VILTNQHPDHAVGLLQKADALALVFPNARQVVQLREIEIMHDTDYPWQNAFDPDGFELLQAMDNASLRPADSWRAERVERGQSTGGLVPGVVGQRAGYWRGIPLRSEVRPARSASVSRRRFASA
jgi:hypothetical protein